MDTGMETHERLPRLDQYFWAIALILAGAIFGADSVGLLPQLGNATAWTWLFLAAGVVGLALSFYSLTSERHAQPTLWDWIFGGILTAIGLSGFLGVNIGLPVLLIVVGVAALASLLLRGSEAL
jgi:hypothetical protein